MKRINCILNNPEFLICLKKNQEAEANRTFCRHDITHFFDVARIAYIIALEEISNVDKSSVDKEIFYALGLLHDIGRWMEYENGTDHAAASKWLAEGILKRCEYSDDEIEKILYAIENHRNKEESSQYGNILYRADKLSRNCTMCNARNECKNFQNNEKPYLLY